MVISYHVTDAFSNPEGDYRRLTYYAPFQGTPTTKIDGIVSVVGGTNYPGTLYPYFYGLFSSRLLIESPLEIELVCNYDSVIDSGRVYAGVTNTSGSSVSGNIHFVLIEDHRPYTWSGFTEVRFVERDMIPDALGEAVTIPVSDTIIRWRDFAVDPSWNENNCRMVVFVQGASREIYQGGQIALIRVPDMEYHSFIPFETSGNANGYGEPGESMELYVMAKNSGTGEYDGTVSIQCTDPNITITGVTPAAVSIDLGDVDTVATVQFDISAGCPDPYTAVFEIDFGSGIDSFPFMITTDPGIVNDFESGQGGWTHSGLRDSWHLTEHRSHSPTHSWYFGLEGSWMYMANSDGSLMTPYFVALPDSPLCFQQLYNTQIAADYCYVEVDNGSGFWYTLSRSSGTQTNWTFASLPLDAYAGQTISIRFRLISGYSVQSEGWYVDDVYVGAPPLGVADNSDYLDEAVGLRVYPNPFKNLTNIEFQIPNGVASIKIYDATGRLINQFNNLTIQPVNQLTWHGDDNLGDKVPAGVYFVKLEGANESLVEKLIITR